jgi:periodic tryptophan protein 2
MATGGDDCKLKVWAAATGLCFVTFSEHEGPITALEFSRDAVLSASLDGTVRAFDLVRMRNFRVLSASPGMAAAQLTSLAVEADIVCAGAMEPANIFVWSLRTGHLLDVLSGHEAPVASIAFCAVRPMLASASWDGTVKLWEPYRTTAAVETFRHGGTNVLCVAFRPDGRELCSAGLDGHLCFWNVDSGVQTRAIDGRRDLEKGAYYTSVCYSADGRCVLAGGRSRWVSVYDVERTLLLKKFQLSHASRGGGGGSKVGEGSGEDEDDDAEDARARRWREGSVPGATRGYDAGKRAALSPDLKVSCVRFSPAGRSWAAATNQGLIVYSLDAALLFDPVHLEEEATPDNARRDAKLGLHSRAMLVALNLGQEDLVEEMLAAVPGGEIALVARGIPTVYLDKTLAVVAKRLEQHPNVELNLQWAQALLTCKHGALADSRFAPSLRAVQKGLVAQERRLKTLTEENLYDMDFLLMQGD